jgi:quercetin dioxygenase-like cupin family protein
MIRSSAALVLALAGLTTGCRDTPLYSQEPDPDQPMVMTNENLEWLPEPPGLPPGAEFAVLEGNPFEGPFTLRLRLPAGYEIPAHVHSLAENVTVISGAVHVGNGDRLDRTRGVRVPAGSFVALPAGSRHYAWTMEPTVVQIHGSLPFDIEYVDPVN